MALTIPVPNINHAGFCIPHMEHPVIIEVCLVRIRIIVKFPIDELQCVLLVRRP